MDPCWLYDQARSFWAGQESGCLRRDLFAQRQALVVEALAFGQVARPDVQFRELRVVACELTATLQFLRLGWRE